MSERKRKRKQNQDEDFVQPVYYKLGVSLDKHPGRAALAEERLRARVKYEAKTPSGREAIEQQIGAQVDFQDEEWVERAVERRLADLKTYSHPRTEEYIREFGPDPACTSKRPPHANEFIEAKVMRELPWMRTLAHILRSRGQGRPSDRKLMMALFEHQALTAQPKVLKRTYERLMECNELLDDCFGYPVGDGTHCRAYNTISQSLGRQLDHHDPRLLVALNGDFLRQRQRDFGPDSNYGKHVVLDGMRWQSHSLQHKGYSEAEEALLNRGMSNAAFGYHGDGDGWRGMTLLVLRDLHSLDILGWMLPAAREREHQSVGSLISSIFAAFPEWQPETLIADREYDTAQLYETLLERYGMHLICPLRDNLGEEYKHGMTDGVPTCSKHGHMKRLRDREFPHQGFRQRKGLKPGEVASIERARVEWECRPCGARKTTYFKHNPRIFGYYPRRGDHKLVGQRQALQSLRNVAESTNASLQYRGFGLKGQARAKWVSTNPQAEWLAGMGLFSMNLRQLIHAPGGPYEQAHEDAVARGLLKPRRSTPGALTVLPGKTPAGTGASAGSNVSSPSSSPEQQQAA